MESTNNQHQIDRRVQQYGGEVQKLVAAMEAANAALQAGEPFWNIYYAMQRVRRASKTVKQIGKFLDVDLFGVYRDYNDITNTDEGLLDKMEDVDERMLA